MPILNILIITLCLINIVWVLSYENYCGHSIKIYKFHIHWCKLEPIYGISYTKSLSFWCIFIGKLSFGWFPFDPNNLCECGECNK